MDLLTIVQVLDSALRSATPLLFAAILGRALIRQWRGR